MLARITAYSCMAFAGLIALSVLAIALKHYFSPVNRRNRREQRRVKRGLGLGVEELASRLDLSVEKLLVFNPSYTRRNIPKRRGGMRTLDVPDAATRDLQRHILHRLLKRLRAHPAARGFEKGHSIVTNALPHAGQAVIVKLDIKDFFNSTTAARIDLYFRRVGWDAKAAALLTRLVTQNGGLPQGAPTSPRLSNLVNYGLDESLGRFAKHRKITYTRYADDMTFSCPKDYPTRVRGIVRRVRYALKRVGYELNGAKTQTLRQHQRQRVTGLVVNDQPNLPRDVRRRLRAVAHHHATGQPATLTPAQLAGYEALLKMIEHQRDTSA